MKSLQVVRLVILAVLHIFVSTGSQAQDYEKNKHIAVQQWVENKHYIFVPQAALPVGRAVRQLTSDYMLKIAGDTVESYLPYFGRSYSAPINPAEGGIRFTSTKSTYTVSPRKKGGWDISIKPGDAIEVQQLRLTIFDNGSASLVVNPTNKQVISFNGYVKEYEMVKRD